PAAAPPAQPSPAQPSPAQPSSAGPASAPAAPESQAAPAPQAPARQAPAAPPSAAPAGGPTASAPAAPTPPLPEGTEVSRLRGAAARTVINMTASLGVPTATSVREIPAKLLIDNRIVINNHLRRGRGGKVSFTHLIGFAVVRALSAMPEMNASYVEVDGKPAIAQPEHVNLGLAID